MNRLTLQFTNTNHPGGSDPRYASEVWGKLDFEMRNKSDRVIGTILSFEGNLCELISWVHEKRELLLHQELPPFIRHKFDDRLSVAETLSAYYETCDTENDEEIDETFSYRVSHGLRFAFRGSNIPDIYLGIKNGIYTVSCIEQDKFAYAVDMSYFLTEVDRLASLYPSPK